MSLSKFVDEAEIVFCQNPKSNLKVINGSNIRCVYGNAPIQLVPTGKSLLKPMSPAPQIPIQFQIQAQKNLSYDKIKVGESLLKNVVVVGAAENIGKPKCVPQVTVAPSGTDSTTDNHANRSLVHEKPVSTNDTASWDNIDNIEIETIDWNAVNSDSDEPLVIPTTDIVELHGTIEGFSNCETSKLSIEPVLFESVLVGTTETDCNESIAQTKIQLSRFDKQNLKQQVRILNEQSGQHFPHVTEVLHQYSEWVRIKRHIFTHFLSFSHVFFLLLLLIS